MRDWEKFYFDKSPSMKKLISYLKVVSDEDIKDDNEILERSEVQMYSKAVADLYDKGESDETLEQYKESVKKILFDEQHTKPTV